MEMLAQVLLAVLLAEKRAKTILISNNANKTLMWFQN
jgi:hypothetical protein